MKLIRILIVIFLLLSAMPLEAFCEDSHCTESASHCVVNCCHSITINADLSVAQVPVLKLASSQAVVMDQSIYENPTLLSLKKPPIVLS